MNYVKVYNSIVAKALKENRTKANGSYYERHHIQPKCLGGSNLASNLVLLTGREHFLCHWLLCRIYPNNLRIVSAFWGMCNQRIEQRKLSYTPSSRSYEEARRSFSELQSKQKTGSGNPMFGKEGPMKNRHHTEETKRVMSSKKLGKISPRKGQKGRPLTDAQRANLSLIHTGKIKSEETRKRMSKPKQKATCPHCSLVGGIGSLKRYHFDNCKQKINEPTT